MKFICDKCSAKYSIADEKIRKKVLKIRCKKCSHVIIVRDPLSRASQRPVSAASHTALPSQSSSSLASMSAAPAAHAPHPARSQSSPHYQAQPQSPFTTNPSQMPSQGGVHLDTTEPPEREERTVIARISADWIRQVREEKQEEPIWFFALHGQPKGPVVLSEVTTHIRSGGVKEDTLVWCGGWPEWVPAGRITELNEAFRQPAAPLSPPPITPPPVSSPLHHPIAEQRASLHTPAAPDYQNPHAQHIQAKAQGYVSQAESSTSHDDLFRTQDSSMTMPSVSSPLHSSPLAARSQNPTEPEPGPAPKVNGSGAFSQTFGSSSSLSSTNPSNDFHPSPLAARGTSSQTGLPGMMPQSQTRPAPHHQDVAHEQQAIPVEFIESGAEEDFFARKSSELLMAATDSHMDSLDIVLPPMPYMEPVEEFDDIDDADIIEIRETLKPKWAARIAVIAGLSVVAVLLVLPMMLNSQDKPRGAMPSLPTQETKTKKSTRKLTEQEKKARDALLRSGGGQAIIPKLTGTKQPGKRRLSKKKRRNSGKKRRRRVKIGIGVSGTNPSKKSIDDLIKRRLAERLKKAGFQVSPVGNSNNKIDSSSNIDKKLVKRLYKELIAKNHGVQYCYSLHLKSGYFDGRLLLSLKIAPNGRVKQVRVSPRKFKGLKFTRCLLREIKYKWRFSPFSGEAVWLESPYSLSAQ